MKKVFLLKSIVVILFLFLYLLPYTAASDGLRFNEIMYDPAGPDKTETGSGREWVEVFNASAFPITIVGGSGSGSWRFVDSDGPHVFAKAALRGSMTIPAGGYAILAADAPTFLKEHPNFNGTVIDTVMNLRNSQDLIKIRDGEGNILGEAYWTSNLGAQGNGRTLEFSSAKVWREGLREGGSPGQENSVENMILPEAPSPIIKPSPTLKVLPLQTPAIIHSPSPTPTQYGTAFPSGVLIISEFLPNPKGDDYSGEWIEIKNESSEEIDLNGWILETNSSRSASRLSGTIQPGAFLVIPRAQSKLSLKNTGDTILLKNPAGDVVFEVSFKNEVPEGWSAARFESGWKITKNPTPGQPNVLLENGNKPATELTFEEPKDKVLKQESKEPGSAEVQAADQKASVRISWILFTGLGLGIVAAVLSLILKRRFLA